MKLTIKYKAYRMNNGIAECIFFVVNILLYVLTSMVKMNYL